MQEGLNNILKHASASQVLIELNQTENELQLFITDNGKGFEPMQKSSGIGVMNMRTRAENSGGNFRLLSTPGQGCQLRVHIPYNAATTADKEQEVEGQLLKAIFCCLIFLFNKVKVARFFLLRR